MKPVIFSSLYLFVLFCLSKFVFDPSGLYYDIWWLDIPMHVMGGFGVASLAAAILSYKDKTLSYKKILLAYFVVAMCWELYEYLHDFFVGRVWGGWEDTLADIVNGLFGAVFSYLLIKK